MNTLIKLKQYLKPVKIYWDTWRFSREAEKHVGELYECPCCGFHSKDLAPQGIDSQTARRYATVGMGFRKGRCWKCRAQDREKLLFLYLRDIERIFDKHQMSILHIAPENIIAKHLLQIKEINYICGDYFAEGYVYPSYVHNMNVLSLSFPDGTFDLIICNHVLEHIEDDRKAMRELFRVLKKGGKGILQVPMSKLIDKTLEDATIKTPNERLQIYGQTDHLRLYGLDYKDRLEECGFRVELFKFPIEVIHRYGLNKEEDIYLCYKD